MQVCGFELTVEQAIRFAHDLDEWSEFLGSHGVAWNARVHHPAIRRAVADFPQDLVDSVLGIRRPRRDLGKRNDVARLVAFVDAGRPLPSRMRAVFERCVLRGETLDVCARELGVGRETVRTHLRRLREMARAAS